MAYRNWMDVRTKGFTDVVNITEFVERSVRESGIREGIGCVFVPGSTAGITTIEYEPGLLKDFVQACERLIPSDIAYAHDRAWGEGNGFSHIRASLLGASFSFPIQDGKPLLGTWQQVVLVDFDNRPRSRKVVIQLVGE